MRYRGPRWDLVLDVYVVFREGGGAQGERAVDTVASESG